jgi:hypothetical protein
MDEQWKNMRERVFETLALIADKEAQRRYQLAVPNVDVAAELFNQWEDCFFPEDDSFRSSFLDEEFAALKSFDRVLNRVCEETPQELPTLEEFVETDAWEQLSAAASVALAATKPTSAAGVAPRE